jgi:hypothetical protein
VYKNGYFPKISLTSLFQTVIVSPDVGKKLSYYDDDHYYPPQDGVRGVGSRLAKDSRPTHKYLIKAPEYNPGLFLCQSIYGENGDITCPLKTQLLFTLITYYRLATT